MSANGTAYDPSRDGRCAEPGCDTLIAPRKPGQTYLLYCEIHRSSHSPLPAGYPAPPAKYGRYTCLCCGMVFEKYLSTMRGSNGRYFCRAECRNTVGARPRGIQPRNCDWCGKEYQPRTKSKSSRFCSREHFDAWVAAQPGKRKYEPDPSDTEVRYCAEPGCTVQMPPKNRASGYQRKWCDEHKNRGRGGRARDTSKMVTLTCSYEPCGREFERYRVQVRYNTTNRYFCCAEHRKLAGSKPRQNIEYICEQCGETFIGRAGAMNRFCGNDCKNEHQRRDQTERVCRREACGKSFWMAPSHRDVYCSNECYRIDRQTPIGKREQTPDGYIKVYNPDHVEAQPATGWVLEHRMVISDLLGRPLHPGEEVHHLWGDRTDNRPEALELWDRSQPPGQRVGDRYKFYKEWCERVDRERPILEAAGVRFHDEPEPDSAA